MKPIVRIVLFSICLIMMNSCKEKGIGKMGFRTRDRKNREMAVSIITGINKRDTNQLYTYFSIEVQEKEISLRSDLEKLISMLNGKITRYEKWAVSADTSIEGPKNRTEYHSTYRLWINDEEYVLDYIYIVRDDFQKKAEGVRSMKLIKKIDEDKYFCYWQDMKPGLFLPKEE